ncbi:biotin transport system substrate-specific component [Clostridium pascui]|uniref:biotin transporter BioY n=1 Tax=Clostridium pascui TaxID=46609 RepID=UPI00195D050A|nr:biotin transporter BioY [Clostridium pascui]MBM7871284.1 biotin transport system substrate-specific component [Clostridium pascui]
MKITTRDMILVSLFTSLTAIGTFIKIPLEPAPINLQFLFTALAGILLGSRLGALSQIVYVTLGLLGLPVFTKPGGLSYIFQPTFGYLIGYIIAAYIIGKLSESKNKPSFLKLLTACISGILTVYIIGVPYLYIILKYVSSTPITIPSALKAGCVIFLPGDLIKCILTAFLGVRIIPVIKRYGLANS